MYLFMYMFFFFFSVTQGLSGNRCAIRGATGHRMDATSVQCIFNTHVLGSRSLVSTERVLEILESLLTHSVVASGQGHHHTVS